MQIYLKKLVTINFHAKLIIKRKLNFTATKKMNSFVLNANPSIIATIKNLFHLMLKKWETQFKIFNKIWLI